MPQTTSNTPPPPLAGRKSAVIFDVEGVIAHPDEADLARRLRALDTDLTPARLNQVRRTPELYPEWERYSVGRIESDAYWSAVLRALGRPESLVPQLKSAMTATWWARIDVAVLDIIDGLRRRGVRLAILSNSAPEHDPVADRLAALVDVAHFSHRVGRRKPDEVAYLSLIERLGTSPAQSVFIDDKPRNTRAAAKLGLRAVDFVSADQLRPLLKPGTPS